MNTRASLLICFLLLSLACHKTTQPAAGPASSPTSEPVSMSDHSLGGSTPAPVTRHFKGSIGSSLDLQMKLVRTGDQLGGSYFYQKVGTPIDLRGTVDKDGNLTLEEFDPSGKSTGVFKGLWSADAKDGLITLAGNWSKPDGEAGSDKKTAFSLHEQPISFTGNADIVTKQINENNKKLRYEIAAQYPQLTGGDNPNFEKFNQLVRGFVMKNVGQFKKNIARDAAEEEPPPEGSVGSDYNVSYEVALAQDDLISVGFDLGGYYQGAAHPNSSSATINYDLKNGKQLKLSDLFQPGSKFLRAIANYCIADLKKQAKDTGLIAEEIESGAGPTLDNYRSWTITRRGLGVNFDSYQVGPYAAGPQFVMVPYAALKDVINPDGPVGFLAVEMPGLKKEQ